VKITQISSYYRKYVVNKKLPEIVISGSLMIDICATNYFCALALLTLSAIIKALYKFTNLPEVEISWKLRLSELSPDTITSKFTGTPDSFMICFTSGAVRLG